MHILTAYLRRAGVLRGRWATHFVTGQRGREFLGRANSCKSLVEVARLDAGFAHYSRNRDDEPQRLERGNRHVHEPVPQDLHV